MSAKIVADYFKKFPNYSRMVAEAKQLARRSVVVDHCGHNNVNLPYEDIEQVYLIDRGKRESKLSLLEFKSEQAANHMTKQANHANGLLPISLNILRYHGTPEPSQSYLNAPVEHVLLPRQIKSPSMHILNYSDLLSKQSMSLAAFKLRFITLTSLEQLLCTGVFHQYELMPFGSSVTDIGGDLSDLDLVVTRKHDHDVVIDTIMKNGVKPNELKQELKKSKLHHLDKSIYLENRDRNRSMAIMRWFHHTLREFVPLTEGHGVTFVQYAKVPIIKFKSNVTDIDCDLSFNIGLDAYLEYDALSTNYSAIIMSHIMYSLYRDNRLFKTFVVYLRTFAKQTAITSKEQQVGLTNFQFLSLIIFYLQQTRLNPNPTDRELFIRGDPCSDTSLMPPFDDMLEANYSNQTEWGEEKVQRLMPELIYGFMEFYSMFNFATTGINLNKGIMVRKPDNSSIFVQNPLDKISNVCRSVSTKGLNNMIRQTKSEFSKMRLNPDLNPLELLNEKLANETPNRRQARDTVARQQ